jgi:hypothetical protein
MARRAVRWCGLRQELEASMRQFAQFSIAVHHQLDLVRICALFEFGLPVFK